jgi:hypothetical protein
MSKNTFFEAAQKVLKEKGMPLKVEEITNLAIERGMINTSGKTPAATMGARIYIDIKNKGNKSLFVKFGRGKFGLKEWQNIEQECSTFRAGSFKEAAYQVLKVANKPLSAQEITSIAKRKTYFYQQVKLQRLQWLLNYM